MTTDANNVLTFRCAGPDFSLALTPPSATTAQGGSATYTATITRDPTFTGAVTFSTFQPNGAIGTTIDFAPNPVPSTASTTTITFTTNSGVVTPPGTYPFTITGTSGTLTHTVNGIFIVSSAAPLTSIRIVPVLPYLDPVYVAAGDAVLLTAIGHNSDGSTQDLTTTVQWSSNKPGTVTVDASGQLTAASQGTATVTARKGATLTATIPVNVGPAELRSIEVFPSNSSVGTGFLIQFSAQGQYSDGSTTNLTCPPTIPAITWSSSSTSIADFVSGCGLVTPAAPGTSTITATTTTADMIDPLGVPRKVQVRGSTSLTVVP